MLDVEWGEAMSNNKELTKPKACSVCGCNDVKRVIYDVSACDSEDNETLFSVWGYTCPACHNKSGLFESVFEAFDNWQSSN